MTIFPRRASRAIAPAAFVLALVVLSVLACFGVVKATAVVPVVAVCGLLFGVFQLQANSTNAYLLRFTDPGMSAVRAVVDQWMERRQQDASLPLKQVFLQRLEELASTESAELQRCVRCVVANLTQLHTAMSWSCWLMPLMRRDFDELIDHRYACVLVLYRAWRESDPDYVESTTLRRLIDRISQQRSPEGATASEQTPKGRVAVQIRAAIDAGNLWIARRRADSASS